MTLCYKDASYTKPEHLPTLKAMSNIGKESCSGCPPLFRMKGIVEICSLLFSETFKTNTTGFAFFSQVKGLIYAMLFIT